MIEPRTINQAGLALITTFEGCKLKAYQDQRGIWTIGYGHTRNVKEGQCCSKDDAVKWLYEDLQDAEECVENKVRVPLGDNQFAALVSFVFNVGSGNFGKSELLKLLNKGWYEQVPAQLMRWCKTNGQENGGLYRRRAAEGNLWRTPDIA